MKRIIYSLLFAAGTLFAGCSDDDTQAPLNTPIQEGNNLYGVVTVSYTHLTLPTILRV